MRFLWVILFSAAMAVAQPYDVVLKGGHVIDPANAIDGVLDVAVSGNRIAAVRANIPASEARKVVDLTGLYVLPGLIDLHAHVFGYEGSPPARRQRATRRNHHRRRCRRQRLADVRESSSGRDQPMPARASWR